MLQQFLSAVSVHRPDAMESGSKDELRVSIGVPTFNRPDGLRRTLECLSAQTYGNIEILVSDNCSPDQAVARVAAEMMEKDARIHFVHQTAALGIFDNFRFVLKETDADFFMWAADDDEWAPTFVARCMNALSGGAVSAMTGIDTLYRQSNKRISMEMPEISETQGMVSNMMAFLRRPTPGMFYGLHRRSALQSFLVDEVFDFYDCYFVLRLLTQGRIVLIPDSLYVAGIDAPAYVTKPVEQKGFLRGIRYLPFYRAASRLIADVSPSASDRMKLEAQLLMIVARLFVTHEGRALLGRLKQR